MPDQKPQIYAFDSFRLDVPNRELLRDGRPVAYQRAIRLNPGYASAHQWYGKYLLTTDRPAEAGVEFETRSGDRSAVSIH